MVCDETKPILKNKGAYTHLKLALATEQFQHFVSNLRESLWGDLNGKTREAWQKFFEADSERQRDRFAAVDAYERNLESCYLDERCQK